MIGWCCARDIVKDRPLRRRFRVLHGQGMDVDIKGNPTQYRFQTTRTGTKRFGCLVFIAGNFLRWTFQCHLIRLCPFCKAVGIVSSNGSHMVLEIRMRDEVPHGGQLISSTLQGRLILRRLPRRLFTIQQRSTSILFHERIQSHKRNQPTSTRNLNVVASIRWRYGHMDRQDNGSI